ncbi:MAG: hypothetical protein IKW64_00040 [Clostridia bacterium]|nr:hypothetical protein [Clostridia bacterium]
MDKDRQRAKEQMKALPFKEKMANFWFYYKIHTIVLAVAMLVIVWSAVQCAKRIDYDLNVSYYSASFVTEENLAKFDEFLKSNIEDVNGNGSIDAKTTLNTANIDGEYLDQNSQAIMMKLQAELASGEVFAYMADEGFKQYIEKVLGDSDAIEQVVDISNAQIVKEVLNPAEGEKVYWLSLAEYEARKGDPKAVAERKNVKAIEKLLFESIQK